MSTNWLSDQDVTTPAHARYAPSEPPPPLDHLQRRRSASPANTMLFLAAVWLIVSAVPVAYMGAGRFDAFWSDLVVGLALCTVALIRLTRPETSLLAVNLALGCWLIAAPFVLGYGYGGAMWNDVLVGLAVLGLTGIGAS